MIVVVASFSCSFAFPRLQNILGTIIISETPVDFPVILVHRDMHLLNSVLKSYSMPQFLNFYFAPITCCLANTTAFIV